MPRDVLRRAIAAIDAANADDPNRIMVRGAQRPKELAHAEMATDWVGRLAPDPSEALLLAARAHHLRRWSIARASYPTGRVGYLRWRKALHERHASDVATILEEVGYEPAMIDRVQDLVRKRGLGTDPEVQTLEDALCLVFLETQVGALTARIEPARMTEILDKTTKKMSAEALGLALDLALDEQVRALLVLAVDRDV